MATPRRFRPTDAFVDESVRRQRYLLACVLAQVHDLPELRMAMKSEFVARNMCLSAVVVAVQRREVQRLIIESRDDDREDERHLIRVRQPAPQLIFEHRRANTEPMLWVADALAWACGAGAAWRRRIDRVLVEVIELRP